MKRKDLYKRKQGEQEIRILHDGRVVMIAPDEQLLEVAKVVDPDNPHLSPNQKEEQKRGAQRSE